MFNKLFELLPDAEHLLCLEPEELAGPLLVCLVSLNDNQCMKSEEIISSSVLSTLNLVGRSERSDLRHVLIVAKMSGFVPQPDLHF